MTINQIMRDRRLSFQARSLYAYLLTADNIPAQKGIAKETGCGLRTVLKYLDELEHKGWIKRFRVPGNGALRTRYELKY